MAADNIRIRDILDLDIEFETAKAEHPMNSFRSCAANFRTQNSSTEGGNKEPRIGRFADVSRVIPE